MKKIKICTVVTGRNLDEFLKNLKAVQRVSDCIELRADYIENLKFEDLDIIKKNAIKESIFTCRSKKEGGLFIGSRIELMKIINKAINLDFNYVDVEISKLKFIDKSKCRKNVKIIGSYHNFDKTPTLRLLNAIVKKIASYSFVNIVKIATMVNNENDVINLTTIIIQKKRSQDLIVLGMGEKGKITRIISPLLGGYLTFASFSKKTAKGQIELKELQKIYKEIK